MSNTEESKKVVYSIKDTPFALANTPQHKSLIYVKKYLMWKIKPLLDFIKKL